MFFKLFKKNKNKSSDIPVEDTAPIEDIGQSEISEDTQASIEPQANNTQLPVEPTPNSALISAEDASAPKEIVAEPPTVVEPIEQTEPAKEKKSFFQRIKQGLSKTSSQLSKGIASLVLGKKQIDDELLEELETQLLMADVGIDATTKIIDNLTDRVNRKQLNDGDALYLALQEQLRALLVDTERPLHITPQQHNGEKTPSVILVVGVNGVGKTTTIGKLTKRFQRDQKNVILAAGDTFRAAAVEQLQIWGDRNNVPVIAQQTGSDSASVIYDALSAAKSRGSDVLIADTAGRLHNKSHLMDELAKVKRVMAKLDPQAPHEVLLVLDAGTGQNAISQAEHFIEAAGVTGLVLTKLDGTAKGGIIFALSERFGLPVRFIGVGEGIDDLQPFVADDFVSALFDTDTSSDK